MDDEPRTIEDPRTNERREQTINYEGAKDHERSKD
jgi:hypothetical protein